MNNNEFAEFIKKKYGINQKLYEILVEAEERPKRLRSINEMNNEDMMFAQGVYHLQHRGFCTVTPNRRIELTQLGLEAYDEKERVNLHSPILQGTPS